MYSTSTTTTTATTIHSFTTASRTTNHWSNTHFDPLCFLIEVNVADMLHVGGQGDIGHRFVAAPLHQGGQLAANRLRGVGKGPQALVGIPGEREVSVNDERQTRAANE